jgi:hypothetical protein
MQKRDWAHVIDVNKPMTNFHELVPEMAHKANTQAIMVAYGISNMFMPSSILSSLTLSRKKLYIILKWATLSLSLHILRQAKLL